MMFKFFLYTYSLGGISAGRFGHLVGNFVHKLVLLLKTVFYFELFCAIGLCDLSQCFSFFNIRF